MLERCNDRTEYAVEGSRGVAVKFDLVPRIAAAWNHETEGIGGLYELVPSLDAIGWVDSYQSDIVETEWLLSHPDQDARCAAVSDH